MSPSQERLVGLDLLKIFALVFIFQFHFLVLFAHHQPAIYLDLLQNFSFLSGHIQFLNHFWFLGWVIVGLAGFFSGFQPLKLGQSSIDLFRQLILLFLFWLLFCWAYSGFSSLTLEWDVYLFLIICFLASFLIGRISTGLKSSAFVLVLSLFLHFVLHQPNAQFFDSQLLNSILFGGCANRENGFPFLSGITFFLFFSKLGQLSSVARPTLKKMSFFEVVFWLISLSISLLVLSRDSFFVSFLNIECLAAQAPRATFWSYLIWMIFWMRLSLIEKFQEQLKRSIGFISALSATKSFLWFYFLSYILSSVLLLLIPKNAFVFVPYLYIILMIGLFVILEACLKVKRSI